MALILLWKKKCALTLGDKIVPGKVKLSSSILFWQQLWNSIIIWTGEFVNSDSQSFPYPFPHLLKNRFVFLKLNDVIITNLTIYADSKSFLSQALRQNIKHFSICRKSYNCDLRLPTENLTHVHAILNNIKIFEFFIFVIRPTIIVAYGWRR